VKGRCLCEVWMMQLQKQHERRECTTRPHVDSALFLQVSVARDSYLNFKRQFILEYNIVKKQVEVKIATSLVDGRRSMIGPSDIGLQCQGPRAGTNTSDAGGECIYYPSLCSWVIHTPLQENTMMLLCMPCQNSYHSKCGPITRNALESCAFSPMFAIASPTYSRSVKLVGCGTGTAGSYQRPVKYKRSTLLP
jgi:hypothetical protein